jgi:hypothetical protein
MEGWRDGGREGWREGWRDGVLKATFQIADYLFVVEISPSLPDCVTQAGLRSVLMTACSKLLIICMKRRYPPAGEAGLTPFGRSCQRHPFGNMTSKMGLFGGENGGAERRHFLPFLTLQTLSPRPEMLSIAKHRPETCPKD